MKLGIFSMPCHPPHRKHVETFQEDLDCIVLADQLGFDEFWLGEHYTSLWENIPDPTLTLAQAAVLTKNIVLATGVNCIPDHNPAQIAHRIAQLDVMLKGRFMWGVGVGAFPGDAVLYEVPQDGAHRTVTQENIPQIIKLWTSDDAGGWSYDSPSGHHQFDFTVPERQEHLGIGYHMKPYQKPYPPLAVAGLSAGSGTLRWAGENGWIPMSIHIASVPVLQGHFKAYEEGCRASGNALRRHEWRIARDVYVADTDEQALEEVRSGSMAIALRDYFIPLIRSFGQLGMYKDDPATPDDAISVESVLNNRWIVGSPDTVARRLREVYEQVGGFGGLLMLHYDWEGENRARWEHSMELLATRVLPQLQDLTGQEAVSAAGAR